MVSTSNMRLIPVALQAVLACSLLSLTSASVALAADHRLHVTEAHPSAQAPGSAFVELQDSVAESFPSPAYTLASLDGSDAVLGQQTFNPPYGFAASTQPFLVGGTAVTPRDATLTIPLAAARKVCFYRGVGTADPIHCLMFGAVPDGQSAQLTATESVVFACPTPDAPNHQTAGSCESAAPSPTTPGPDTAPDSRPPGLTVSARPAQRIGRLRLSVTSDERGAIAVTGSIRLGGRTLKVIDATREAGAGARVTIAVRLKTATLRSVRRALERGRIVAVKLRITARDDAGNRSSVRRSVKLKR